MSHVFMDPDSGRETCAASSSAHQAHPCPHRVFEACSLTDLRLADRLYLVNKPWRSTGLLLRAGDTGS